MPPPGKRAASEILKPDLVYPASGFERLGYFALDRDSTADHQVWNRVVTLRDTWAKVARAPK